MTAVAMSDRVTGDGDHVGELLGFVLDLEHGPPPEGR
jgi:hypothetical protein